MVNGLNPNVTISAKWGMHMKMFNRMLWQIEGMDASVQPVFTNAVALGILNCLKMEETIGKSYDLGGPHTYQYQEISEMFFKICQIKPYAVTVPMEDVYYYHHMKWW